MKDFMMDSPGGFEVAVAVAVALDGFFDGLHCAFGSAFSDVDGVVGLRVYGWK